MRFHCLLPEQGKKQSTPIKIWVFSEHTGCSAWNQKGAFREIRQTSLLALLRPGLVCFCRKRERILGRGGQQVPQSSQATRINWSERGVLRFLPRQAHPPQLSMSPLRTARHEQLERADFAHSQLLTFHFRFKSSSLLPWFPKPPSFCFHYPSSHSLGSLWTIGNTSHNLFSVFLSQLNFYHLDMYTFYSIISSVMMITLFNAQTFQLPLRIGFTIV